jgi:hypothetical protein
MSARKVSSRTEHEGVIAAKRTILDPLALPSRVPLRHVFFLNNEKSRYFSVGFYPARYYRVFMEFGGPRIAPITLTEQHMKTLVEHLPKLCEAMYRGERYVCKDGVFGLQCSGTNSVAKMYQNVIFKLADLRYMMNMLHFVQVRQTKYILARDDVRAYAIAALGSSEFVESNPAVTGLTPYDKLFDELKTIII